MCEVAFNKSVTNNKIILYINIQFENTAFVVQTFFIIFFAVFMFFPVCAFSAISEKSIFNVFKKIFLLIYDIVLLLI